MGTCRPTWIRRQFEYTKCARITKNGDFEAGIKLMLSGDGGKGRGSWVLVNSNMVLQKRGAVTASVLHRSYSISKNDLSCLLGWPLGVKEAGSTLENKILTSLLHTFQHHMGHGNIVHAIFTI